MHQVSRIYLGDISCDRKYHCRSQLDQPFIIELAAMIVQGRGKGLQPLALCRWRNRLVLVDGHHHYWAWCRASDQVRVTKLPALVYDAPPAFLCLQLFGVAEHRSPADVARAVEMALGFLPEAGDAAIATLLNCPQRQVAQQRWHRSPQVLPRLSGAPRPGQRVVSAQGWRGVAGKPWASHVFASHARVLCDGEDTEIPIPFSDLYLELLP